MRGHLHGELSGVSACHRGALTGSQYADTPDVESGGAVSTAQEHTLCNVNNV